MSGEQTTFYVGWLDNKHNFTVGRVSETFIEKLKEFVSNPTIRTRGFHECDFCKPLTSTGQLATIHTSSTEIVVRGYGGKDYRAPGMILHYIEAHHYRPPQAFVDAVLMRQRCRNLEGQETFQASMCGNIGPDSKPCIKNPQHSGGTHVDDAGTRWRDYTSEV